MPATTIKVLSLYTNIVMLIVHNFIKHLTWMKWIFTILLAMAFEGADAQRLSGPERCWIFWHPFAAIKVKLVSRQCDPIYNELAKTCQPDCYRSGGKLDAFRHVFYMAAFARKISPRKLRKLGTAHEKGNYRQFTRSQYEEGERPDSLASVMDLRNNEAGFILGRLNKGTGLSELAKLVMTEINNGGGWMAKRNAGGIYVDCENRIIDIKEYSGKWFVPKCLVKTNE
jgi:hypothetical protein